MHRIAVVTGLAGAALLLTPAAAQAADPPPGQIVVDHTLTPAWKPWPWPQPEPWPEPWPCICPDPIDPWILAGNPREH